MSWDCQGRSAAAAERWVCAARNWLRGGIPRGAGSSTTQRSDDLRIMVYTAEPGTEDADRLALALVVGNYTLVDT